MTEFSNRLDTQRAILKMVNNNKWPVEELFGLSAKAIARWIQNNSIDANARIVELINNAAERLMTLATKSQEQVTEDYAKISLDVSRLIKNIDFELKHLFKAL